MKKLTSYSIRQIKMIFVTAHLEKHCQISSDLSLFPALLLILIRIILYIHASLEGCFFIKEISCGNKKGKRVL